METRMWLKSASEKRRDRTATEIASHVSALHAVAAAFEGAVANDPRAVRGATRRRATLRRKLQRAYASYGLWNAVVDISPILYAAIAPIDRLTVAAQQILRWARSRTTHAKQMIELKHDRAEPNLPADPDLKRAWAAPTLSDNPQSKTAPHTRGSWSPPPCTYTTHDPWVPICASQLTT